MATMAEVIYDATLAMCDGIANEPQARKFSQDIAAAVAAHLLSDTAVDLAAQAIDPMAFNADDPRWNLGKSEAAAFLAKEKQTARGKARAAISAALGEHEGVERG